MPPLIVAPLIVTATLDPPVQERFERLRRAHFPPARNHLPAHVTLFHQLPGEELGAVAAALDDAVRRPTPPVEISGVRFLGGGVAYDLRSAELERVRAELAAGWAGWLSAQDRRRFAPHVTVQNKVAPERARALHVALTAEFVPVTTTATALHLWRYLGGPWEPVRRHPFRPASPPFGRDDHLDRGDGNGAD